MESGYCILYIGSWDAAGSYLVELFAGTPRLQTLHVIANFTDDRMRRVRREDCVKRDLAGVGGEWRTRASDGEWRRRRENIDDRYRCQPHPDFMNKEESNNNGGIRIPVPLEFT